MARGNDDLARRLRGYRAVKGVSQYWLADRSGISRATIANIESGQNINPGLETVRRLASALGVSVGNLTEAA